MGMEVAVEEDEEVETGKGGDESVGGGDGEEWTGDGV